MKQNLYYIEIEIAGVKKSGRQIGTSNLDALNKFLAKLPYKGKITFKNLSIEQL